MEFERHRTVEDSCGTGRMREFAVGRGGVGEGWNERGRSHGGVMIRAMLRESGGGPRISSRTGLGNRSMN